MSLQEQAVRLLRTRWRNANTLAQELYAMFTVPDATAQGPQTTTLPDGSAAPFETYDNYTPGNSLFQINGRGGAPIGDIVLSGDGNIIFQPAAGWPGKRPAPAASGTAPYPQGSLKPPPWLLGAAGGGGIPGQVQSGGPGAGPYVVKIYPNGLAGATQNVNVTQLSIDSGDTIPANTWVFVTQVGGTYYMQVPVWLPG